MKPISPSELEAILDAQSPWRRGGARFHLSSQLPERKMVDTLWKQLAQDINGQRGAAGRRGSAGRQGAGHKGAGKQGAGQQIQHKVISGPRRVGKTTLLRHLAPRLIQQAQVAPEMVVYFSLDEPALSGQSFDAILGQVVRITEASLENPAFVLVDEVAYGEHWDRALKISYDDPERYPVRIVATSSSAVEITRGIRESGAGRWVHHFLLPSQFAEQAMIAGRPLGPVDFFGDKMAVSLAEMLAGIPQGWETPRSLREALDEFSVSGGFPEGAYALGDDGDRSARISEHYNNLREALVKVTRVDIPQMFRLRYPEKPGELLYLLAQAPCGLLNLDDLARDLGITKPTVQNLFSYLADAMVVFRLANYTGTVRKARKSFFHDNAVAAALSYGTRETMLAAGRGWVLENMVGAALYELERQSQFGTRLFHYKENGGEVDFVLVEGGAGGGESGAGQASVAIEVGSSHRHDLSGLRRIVRRYPEFAGNAYLVAPGASADHSGDIKTLPLAEFLLAVEQRRDQLISQRSGLAGESS